MATLNKFTPVEGAVYKDIELNNTAEDFGATPKLYAVEVDNSGNALKTVLHIWDKATAPVLGTDEADWIITIPAGEQNEPYLFEEDGQPGITFTNKGWIAATTVSMGTASPANDVIGRIWTDGS